MYCRSCWANLPDGSATCSKCGADLSSQSSSGPATSDSSLTTSGSSPAAGRKGARNSGTKPRIRLQEAEPAAKRPPKIGRFILILILACIAGYFYYLNNLKVVEDITSEQLRAMDGETGQEMVIRLGDAVPDTPGAALSLQGDTATGSSSRGLGPEIDEGRTFMDEGDYEAAYYIFRNAHIEKPGNGAIKEYLVASLNNLGATEYNAGDLELAEGYFREALDFGPSPDTIYGLASVLANREQYGFALETLEPLLDSPNAKVSKLLTRLYYKLAMELYEDNDFNGALDYLREGLAIEPGNTNLNFWLQRVEKEAKAEEGFRTKEGSHFTVKFEGGVNSTAGHLVALLLEEAYLRIGYDLSFYPEDRVTAILYSGQQFRDVTRSPSWAGAIFDGTIKLPAGGLTEKTRLLEKTLFHEYGHAVVLRMAKGKRVPTWLNEGFAQYVEGDRSDKRDSFIKQLASSGRLSLRNLEGSFLGLDSNGAQVAYTASLSSVEYLIDEFGISSVKWILEALGRGMSMDDAMRKSIYLSYDNFEDSWLSSLKR